MPIFEYKCEECGHFFERLSYKEKDIVICPKCGHMTKKVLSPCNFDIKGYNSSNCYNKEN